MNADPASSDRAAVIAAYRRHVNRGIARLARFSGSPLEVRSEGTRVYDERGQAYLDCGGYGVFILGHCHPAVVEAATRQLRQHPVATRVLLNAELARAAEALVRVTPPGLDYVYLAGSGTEATEAAIKLARLNGKRKLVTTRGGFHGKTLGALSVTGRALFQEPFQPLLPDVEFVSYGDADALASVLAASPDCCVILEPVQAEGGVNVPPDGYLSAVERLCREHGALLVLDEIQTGLGRLGAWWGADRAGVRPDLLLAGKALGGGVLPVSAVVATAEVFEGLNRDPFLHTSTFAGSPLASATARAAIETIERERIVERARVLGERLLREVTAAVDDVRAGLIRDLRGVGLLIGFEFEAEQAAGEFVLELLGRHVLVSQSLNANRVVRLTPPAILSDEDVAWLTEAVGTSARAVAERYRPRRDAHAAAGGHREGA